MKDIFSAFVTFSKVEDQPDGSLLVFGRATQEVGDSQGEIMDYKTSAPQFKLRANEVSKGTNGTKVMPLRAMHQPVAAGNVVQFDFMEDEKAIDICAHVLDQNEVKKVRGGVYTGFSVGGRYLKRWPDMKSNLMRFTADPHEISLVDVPSVPTAKFTMFKIDSAPEDLGKGGSGSGNFGHKGGPGQIGGSGGGGSAAIGLEDKELENLINNLFVDNQDENGFSYNPYTDESPTSGFMSSEYPERMVLMKTEDLKVSTLKKFVMDNYDLLSDKDHYVGAWAQKYGDVYLDISKRFGSESEAISSAIDHHQAGIFDLNEMKTVYTSPKFDPNSSEFDKTFLDEFISGKKDIKGVNKTHEVHELLKVIGDRVGISLRTGSPSTPPPGYPVSFSDYGDPANFDFPVDENHWGESMDRFNKGNLGNYSPREWHVLGRRITLSGSRYGATYDPSMKKITGKEHKMSDLEKLDVGALLQTLKAATSVALSNASDQVSKDALTSIMGQLDDLSTPIGKGVPTPTDPGTALKADMPDEKNHAEPDGDEGKGKDSKESKVPAEFVEKMASFEKQLTGLGDVVSKLTEVLTANPAPAIAKSGQGPLNNLNALLNVDPQGDPVVDNAIIKALEEGGPYAMAKALKAAAGDDEFANGSMAYERVYNAIRQASYHTLEKGGVITQNRHIQKLYTPEGGIFS